MEGHLSIVQRRGFRIELVKSLDDQLEHAHLDWLEAAKPTEGTYVQLSE